MQSKNSVFIGTSLDGYIADKHGGIEWLDIIPNKEGSDMGYYAFMDSIDALVMGRKTFEKVLSFGIEWPYKKKVYVLSRTLKTPPEGYADKIEIVAGELAKVVTSIHKKGDMRLYIDGGETIISFLKADLINEMIITRIPILLGSGIPLFGDLQEPLLFELVDVKKQLNQLVQSHYIRKREWPQNLTSS